MRGSALAQIRQTGAAMNFDQLRESSAAVVTVKDAADILGVDRRTLTGALSVHGGPIRAVQVGRRVVIPRETFLRWLDGDDASGIVPTAVEAERVIGDRSTMLATMLRAMLHELERT